MLICIKTIALYFSTKEDHMVHLGCTELIIYIIYFFFIVQKRIFNYYKFYAGKHHSAFPSSLSPPPPLLKDKSGETIIILGHNLSVSHGLLERRSEYIFARFPPNEKSLKNISGMCVWQEMIFAERRKA